ncbi:hypothetical protein BD410DRAFT_773683 [Rickenella mellea]|uniref:Dynamin-type G domain-containing protein n=1 Tax=Rickenella mellea TaxID=50990 RepID=A0A4Y7PYX9_9AGAM|nr:hypothetical protein BD410DRAFT_773683 [Rickenella mellea]
MAQSYFPVSARCSTPVAAELAPTPMNATVMQQAYVERKDSLVHAIDSTKSILTGIRDFNKEDWVVRYPHFRDSSQEQLETTKRPGYQRRSMSFADDPRTETEVVFAEPRKSMTRSLTLASLADVQEELAEQDNQGAQDNAQVEDSARLIPSAAGSDFRVLRLDLKLGPSGSSSSPTALVSQLEKNSIANLIDERITSSLSHVDKLRARVEDTASKVLVTGDLNAGKSTLVNALLRRELMPVDQQPCTSAFCEVHDVAENGGVEEAHIVKEGAVYDIKDVSTFTRARVVDLEEVISENENAQAVIKLYIADPRPSAQSFLNNGIADISLIDAPGLNRDSLKTTALFARQEEIDVIVFVVSAENHFTLSAKEFLLNASSEKAYVFVVVNKYEQIKDKNKCRRLVLEQIKQLSPRTYEDAEDLVHFVDSGSVLNKDAKNPSFETLESALRSFVLVKRSKSKLQPASTYLSHLLSDIDLLAGSNAIVAQSELDSAQADLNRVRPELEKMKSSRDGLETTLGSIEDGKVYEASTRTKSILTAAVDRVGTGELAVKNENISMPTYPGLLRIWDYARDVRCALLASLDSAVEQAEDDARVITTKGFDDVADLAQTHLPAGVERKYKNFHAQAMFTAFRETKGNRKIYRRPSRGTVIPGSMYTLGLGLTQHPELVDTTFFDIFDVQHQFAVYFGDVGKHTEEEDDATPSALGIMSVGIGALTMVGGKAIGARGLVEGVLRVSDLIGNESTRKWLGPVLAAATIGLTAYVVLELPNTIPRTVGRRVRSQLLRTPDGYTEDAAFIPAHARRISGETRKVLRMASWDVRERFRGAMEDRAREVKGAEEIERKAKRAVEYFGEVGRKTGEVRSEAGLVGAQ